MCYSKKVYNILIYIFLMSFFVFFFLCASNFGNPDNYIYIYYFLFSIISLIFSIVIICIKYRTPNDRPLLNIEKLSDIEFDINSRNTEKEKLINNNSI
jgi:hypothetical protein